MGQPARPPLLQVLPNSFVLGREYAVLDVIKEILLMSMPDPCIGNLRRCGETVRGLVSGGQQNIDIQRWA
jgi:hypothetical protein